MKRDIQKSEQEERPAQSQTCRGGIRLGRSCAKGGQAVRLCARHPQPGSSRVCATQSLTIHPLQDLTSCPTSTCPPPTPARAPNQSPPPAPKNPADNCCPPPKGPALPGCPTHTPPARSVASIASTLSVNTHASTHLLLPSVHVSKLVLGLCCILGSLLGSLLLHNTHNTCTHTHTHTREGRSTHTWSAELSTSVTVRALLPLLLSCLCWCAPHATHPPSL